MKAKYIIEEIEKRAPLSLMAEFDCAGLNLGNENEDIKGVLVCQNVTINVLDEAIKNDCNMIISHHPAIWGEELDLYTKKVLRKAKKNNMVLYSAHTNLDAAKDGINERLCKILNADIIKGEGQYYRIAQLKEEKSLKKLIKEIKEKFDQKIIRSIGKNKTIKNICISSGAGARDDELVELLKKEKVGLLIGGENKLSLAIKMRYYNIGLIEIGHYNSEICCMDIFKEWLSSLDIKIIKSKEDKDPYNN